VSSIRYVLVEMDTIQTLQQNTKEERREIILEGKRRRNLDTPSEQKRREKKIMRERVIHTELPMTQGHLIQKELLPTLTISKNTHMKSHEGVTILRLFAGGIPSEFLTILKSSTKTLVSEFPPEKGTSKRNDIARYHFGYWSKYQSQLYLSSQSRNPASENWLHCNKPLFDFLGTIFKSHYPELYARYDQILQSASISNRLIGPWCTLALNINFACDPHRDLNDYRNGLCWVMAFGDFTGGKLVMDDLKVEVDMTEGNIVCFKSYYLTHHVQDYIGERNSIVFFTHDENFLKIN